MTPDLVIFDCDGVLVDSEGITNQLLRDDLATRGLDMPLDQIMSLFGVGADIPVDWVDGFYKEMYAGLARGTPLIDGVTDVLDRLDAVGVPYAVGSNGSLDKMAITLGQHPGVNARLKDHLYSAHVLGIAKPEPDMFLKAAVDFGVAPERCVVVDDSPTGCIAAQRAGMRCLGFAEHDDGSRVAAVGAEVVHSMAEVARALGI